MTSALTTLQQWLLFTGTALVVGCATWRVFIAPRAARSLSAGRTDALRAIVARVTLLALVSALTLVIAWGLRMVVQVMAFRDPFVPLSEDVSFLLFQTSWGTIWMVQGVVVLLLGGVLRRAARRVAGPASGSVDPALPVDASWWATAFLALVLTATLALSSHAMGVDANRAAIVTADALHMLAAGGWTGSLAVILVATRGSARAPGASDPEVFAAQIRGFSPVALVGGTTLVAMGVVLSWTHLTAVSDFWATGYGRILAGKIGLAVLVLGLGALNWRRGLPVCDTPDGALIVRRRATVEVTLALGVVLATAFLVHSAKP